jgi:hypothetical protein
LFLLDKAALHKAAIMHHSVTNLKKQLKESTEEATSAADGRFAANQNNFPLDG